MTANVFDEDIKAAKDAPRVVWETLSGSLRGCGSDFHNERSLGFRISPISVEQCNTGSTQFQVFSISSQGNSI